MKILERFFYYTYRLGQQLLRISKKNDCVTVVVLVLLLQAVFLNIPLIIRQIALLCFFIVLFVKNADALVSVKKFLGMGLVYWFVITKYVILLVEYQFDKFGNIIGYVVFGVSWCFYSLIANNKVATVANQIISTILACIVLLKDTMISLVPNTVMDVESIAGYTNEKQVEIIFNLGLNPILAINLFTVLLCTLKGYWIQKYNNNKDLEYENQGSKESENEE